MEIFICPTPITRLASGYYLFIFPVFEGYQTWIMTNQDVCRGVLLAHSFLRSNYQCRGTGYTYFVQTLRSTVYFPDSIGKTEIRH